MGALLTQFMNKYAYTDFHELNADWMIRTMMELINQVENFVSLNAIKYADPIQWNITSQYEKNTVVIDPLTGTAYISVQPVPMGVALTNTDYWTVVFDLGSFVVRAAKNFSNRYEADTTLTATFASIQGDWLVWGDTLYEVIVPNINAGDQYFIDSNIRHITMEEVCDALAQAIDAVDSKVGDLTDLNTSDQTSIVNAINEVLTDIGTLNNLNTTDQSSIVNAINEVLTDMGTLNDLNTTDQSSIVNAINEVLDDVQNFVTPEQFGAKGDGVTDDAQPILDAIATGKAVYLENSYYIGAKITLNNTNVILIGSDVSQLIYDNNDDMFLLDSCVMLIKNVSFNCTGTGIIFNSVSTEYKLENVNISGSMSVLDQRTDNSNNHCSAFINCHIDTTANGIIYYGNSNGTCTIENCYISTNDLPYFITLCKFANVIGGEFMTKAGAGSCNLYSVEYGTITDGFYHDMVRGATIGGPAGKCGTITGTKNTNVSFSGISVDWATNLADPFSEGKAIVYGNIIETEKNGIYAQGRKMIIANNEIYCHGSVSGTKYAIRLNCNESPIVDHGSMIINNIIDCNNDVDTFPIYLAMNTIATIKDNSFVNTVLTPSGLYPSYNLYEHVYNADDSSFVPYDNVGISNNWGVYIVDNITANKNIYLPTWGANSRLTDVGRIYLVINKSNTYTVTINRKGTDTHIYSITSDNYVPPTSCALLISIGEGDWLMMPYTMNSIL